MKRMFLFLQGMAGMALFPLGPVWLLLLLNQHQQHDKGQAAAATDATTTTAAATTTGLDDSVASTAWNYSLLVLIYILGQCLGASSLVRSHVLSLETSSFSISTRLCSLTLGLLGLTWYFAASGNLSWLLWTRFVAATLCGFMASTTTMSMTWFFDQQTAKLGIYGAVGSLLLGGMFFFWKTEEEGGDGVPKDTTTTTTNSFLLLLWPLALFVILTVASESLLKFLFPSPSSLMDVGGHGGGRRRTLSSSSYQQSLMVAFSNSEEEGRIRNRFDTGDSEFFDCQSVLSDGERLDFSGHGSSAGRRVSFQGLHVSNKNDDEICLYKDNQCVYPDGEPSYVTQGDSVNKLPDCYLEFYRGNRDRALAAWRTTQQWRAEKQVWRIHTLPNVWYPQIKEAYQFFIHGHSKNGFPIVYEQPGKMNLKNLFRSGCEIEDMVFHYRYLMEYVSNVVCTRPEIRALGSGQPHSCSSWGIMVVMDVQGAGLSHLSGDVVAYLKQAGDTNSAHYPQSMKRAFLINSPFWLAGAWSGIKGILPESVQVDILGTTNYLDSITKYIDLEQIPPEYGGTSPYPLGQHPYELGLKQLAESEITSTEPSAQTTESNEEEKDEEQSATVPAVISAEPSVTAPSTPVGARAARSSPVPTAPKSPVTPTRASFTSVSSSEVPWLVHVLHSVTSGTRTSLEVFVPLFMLSSTKVGGLGFSPFQAVITMLAVCGALWWALSKNRMERILELRKRAFRLGMGLQAACIGLWAGTATSILKGSFLGMAFACIILTVTAIANQLALSASLSLQNSRTKTTNSWMGEILGAVTLIPLWTWSVSEPRPPPFDASSCLFVVSLISICLYVGSFSLLPDIDSNEQCLGEAVTVATADMAYLLEQQDPKRAEELRNSRGRTFSGSSFGNMERGEKVRKAK